jgi:hypothetical protein
MARTVLDCRPKIYCFLGKKALNVWLYIVLRSSLHATNTTSKKILKKCRNPCQTHEQTGDGAKSEGARLEETPSSILSRPNTYSNANGSTSEEGHCLLNMDCRALYPSRGGEGHPEHPWPTNGWSGEKVNIASPCCHEHHRRLQHVAP